MNESLFIDMISNYEMTDNVTKSIIDVNIKEVLSSFDYIDFMMNLEKKFDICFNDDFLSLPVVDFIKIKEYLEKC